MLSASHMGSASMSLIGRLVWVFTAVAAMAASTVAVAQPTLIKSFVPATIGPGSASQVRFQINNDGGTPVTDLEFTDVLPAGVALAAPAHPTTTCPSGLISAPDGGTTITFTGGALGANSSCTVSVYVTSSTLGMHTNPAITLSSSAGSSMSLPVDLTVDAGRPGFSKVFAPSTVQLGGRSTLTFSIDNSANATAVNSGSFSDTLPVGLVIAEPSGLATDCGTAPVLPTVSAAPDGNAVSLSYFGNLTFPLVAAGASCTLTVDVVAQGSGQLDNISGVASGQVGISTLDFGLAVDSLQVNRDLIHLSKSFVDDPVPPGGMATLQFTLTNFSRTDDATNIAFSDDLDATLSGLQAVSAPTNTCGGMATSGFPTSVFGYDGGTLAAGASCLIELQLAIPAGASPGTYTNTTSTIAATIGGSPVLGSAGSDLLFVSPAPTITKTFLDNPVAAGDSTTLEFTITNTSATSSATNVAFTDFFATILPTASVTPAAACCGAGSSCTFFQLVNPMGNDVTPARLFVSGGTLAPAGMAGDSCTFSLTLNVSSDAASGIYPNVTTQVSATVDGETRTGGVAKDDLEVVGGVRLVKQFTDDPVLPGDTVTLQFEITHDGETNGDATAISFTDDLDAALSGLVAVGLPVNDVCGTGSQISGTSILSFTDGTLATGESCTFNVTLQVPAAAPTGFHTNTTSNVSTTVSGLTIVTPSASDDLLVAALGLSKEFIDDPVLPGGTATLRFTIDNTNGTLDATGMSFTDDLGAVLTNATFDAGSVPATPCGGSVVLLSANRLMSFSGGSVTAGTSCTFDMLVQVPVAAANGVYRNRTTSLNATIGGTPVVLPAASDVLTVNDNLLLLEKQFTDDPVMPGGTVTLQFTLTNQDAANSITGIAFTDDLDAALSGLVATGLPMNDVCGAGSQISGAGLLSLTGGNLPVGGSCTFSVMLNVPAGASSGDYLNTTSSATGTAGGLGVTGDPASDSLHIRVVDFSKAFDGPSAATRTAQLSFTIHNIDASNPASGLGFTDDLDAVLTGLVAVGLPASDVCGVGSQISGTNLLTMTGGDLGPGESCTITVNVLLPATAMAGTYPNTSSDLTASGLTVAVPAMADLVVEPPPSFAKAFTPATVGVGQASTLTFTIDNTASALVAAALNFTDNLPAGMTVAPTPNAGTTCAGGTINAGVGATAIAYSGGTVGSGSVCTLSVDVVASTSGAMVNTSGDLTSNTGNSGTASDTLTVIPQPGFSKAFAPTSIVSGGVSTLTFTIDNTASTVALANLAFVDNLPAGMTVATPPNASTTCTGGTLTASAGSGSIQYVGGSVAAGASCTVQADVTATTPGSYANGSSALTSDIGSAGVANATLTVLEAPLFGKAFAPATVALGAVSTLSFSIDNSANVVDATGLDFSDNLPAGMVVATPANGSTTCTGGTLTAASGTTVVSYSGGMASAGAGCSVQVDVEAQAAGTLNNTTGDLTSSAGNSGPASASLTVSGADIAISKAFQSDPVLRGGQVVLRYTINNLSPSASVDSVAFSDDLGAVIPGWAAVGLPLADACGAGSSVSGTTVVSLSAGSIPAAGNCSFDVTLQLPGTAALGTVTSTTAAVTANAFGNPITGNTASDDLTVVWLGFTKAFVYSGSPVPGSDIGLMFSISNPDPLNAVSGITFSDDLGAAVPGMFANGLPMSGICGAGSQIAGSSVVTLSNGSIAAGGSCSFQISVHIPNSISAGTYTNNTSPLTATPAGGLASSGDPADIASASIALPSGVPAPIVAPNVIPTLDPRMLILLVAMLGLLAVTRVGRMN